MEKLLTDGEIHENRLLWIDALRSGKYRQCKGTLYDVLYKDMNHVNFGYCCLGVAYKALTGQDPDDTDDTRDSDYEKISNLLGISDIFDINGFIRMNDVFGYSFSQIADEAEKLFGIPSTEATEART